VKPAHILRPIPLIGVVALVYWLVALFGADALGRPVLTIGLPSGTPWAPTTADFLLLLGLVALYFEILKSTRASQTLDHILSLGVFIACLVGFLLVARLGSSTFLLLLVMSLIDVIAGFSVALTAARRDITYTDERT
jgi:ABC-type uncharacterized transport system permease subunit